MSSIESIRRFTEKQQNGIRHPGVVVIEFGGGDCNKAGAASCREFCQLNNKIYQPSLDPSADMIAAQFRDIAVLRPAIVSIVPNGEAVNTLQQSNTSWDEVSIQVDKGTLSPSQRSALRKYYTKKFHSETISSNHPMTPAEKMALSIGLGKNAGLSLSLTTNGSFLSGDLLKLYKEVGLDCINLSYHPNKQFDPDRYDPALVHLINLANEAIKLGIIPTITYVLTSQNADTFVAVADYVTEHDIFFAVGIANARGRSFSTANESIEPTDKQVTSVFRRLLARKLFADRHIRTTIPYLLMAPYLRHWVCDQSTDFFHISIEEVGGKLQPKLNVCSEVRDGQAVRLENFLINKDGLDTPAYLKWRAEVMRDSENGCNSCTHQCYFESEARGTLNIGKGLEKWDWYTTGGKGVRQRYTFRHPLRPTVSQRGDFQKPYLWETLLQSMARIVIGLKDDPYWQDTFRRSGVNFNQLLTSCVSDAMSLQIINDLVQAEKDDYEIKIWRMEANLAGRRNPTFTISFNWHDANSLQSRIMRAIYMPFQKTSKEAGITIPTLHYRGILDHESEDSFRRTIEDILTGKRKQSVLDELKKAVGDIYQMIKAFFQHALAF